MTNRVLRLEADPMDFAPAMVRAQATPPSPLPRAVLYALLVLYAEKNGGSVPEVSPHFVVVLQIIVV